MVHELSFVVACSAGVFWARECTFSYLDTVLDLVTVEDWGEEIFAEGVGVKWKNEPVGRGGEVISSAPPPTPTTLTGQVSNYDPRWRHRKPDLSSVPLQNNGCTAG